MTHTSTDFQTLPPAPKVVTVSGTTLELTPIRLGELPRLLAVVRSLATDLSANLSAEPDWFDLLTRHGEAVLDLLALTTRRERAWVNDLSLDEAVTLAAAVFEVNADFFVGQVAPAIRGAAQRLAPSLGPTLRPMQAGTTPSPA